jgi:hypothetical protein
MAIALAVINGVIVGGSLYWQEQQSAEFESWPVVQATVVSAKFSPQPGLFALLYRPVYRAEIELTVAQEEEKEAQTVYASFEHQSLRTTDTDRLRQRLTPGRDIRIRRSPSNPAEAYVPGTHVNAASEVLFSVGLLMLIPTAALYLFYRLAVAFRMMA